METSNEPIILSVGAHESPDQGTCIIESYRVAHDLPFNDQTPPGVSPVLAKFLRAFNDGLGRWDERVGTARLQDLLPYRDRLEETAGTLAVECQRSLLALDWLMRVCLPTWLRLVPSLSEHAEALAALAPLTEEAETDYHAVGMLVRAAEAAAWAAAGDAAEAAAGDAAGDAAWDAASAAASAARAAARAAATWAAWDAASAARAAARAAAWAAAWHAAGAATMAAAVQRLAPTVAALQTSAFGLLDRMLAVPTQQLEEVRE